MQPILATNVNNGTAIELYILRRGIRYLTWTWITVSLRSSERCHFYSDFSGAMQWPVDTSYNSTYRNGISWCGAYSPITHRTGPHRQTPDKPLGSWDISPSTESSDIYDSEVARGLLQLSKITATRGHSLKLVTQPSRVEIRRNSFAVRVVKPWNSLPEEVVMSSSVRVFEARLNKFGKEQPVKFNFREELRA